MPSHTDSGATSATRPRQAVGTRPGHGLAFKLALCILVSTTLVFTAAFAYYYHASKDLLLKNVRENARNLTRSTVGRIETTLARAEQIPLYLADALGGSALPRETLLQSLQNFLAANADVYGTAVAYAPKTPGAPTFAPYYYRKDGAIEYAPLDGDYDYSLMDWYLVPSQVQRSVWSEPYFDEGGGNIVMTTFSAPFFRGRDPQAPFLGVVTADLSLEWLRKQISKIALYQSGYAFLVSGNGVFVSHPDNRLVMRESIFSLAEAAGSRQLREIGQAMTRGEEGFVRLPDFMLGKAAWLSFAPVPATGWSLGVIVPEGELFADLTKLGREVLAIGAAGFLVLLAVIAGIAASITRPLSKLAATASVIARGDLDTPVPMATGRDEVGVLSRSFEQMRLALKDYIADLTATTKAKERLESELKIARTIQMSFLPKRFPPFPDITSFELHAALEPAWEVGGDLYDFFLAGEDKILFLVGDVSGKGVPAALFMAVAKTLIKGIAEQESDPAAILSKVNRELCVDNESMLFVTMFLAILDLASGEMTFSNAGHNPPARIAPDGSVSWLSLPRGVFLGIMEDAVYQTASLTLAPGETLTAFTDGVIEAMDVDRRLYGTDRLLATLAAKAGRTPEDLDDAVMASVRAFAGEAPQADDITILSICYRGPRTA